MSTESTSTESEPRDGEVVPPPYFFGHLNEQEALSLQLPNPFATSGWISHCRDYSQVLGLGSSARARIARAVADFVPLPAALRPSLPPHLADPLRMIERLVSIQGRVSVLDVGGGFGDNFWHLRSAIANDLASRLDYVVVDNAESCALGEKLFATHRWRPRFQATIPKRRFDLVLMVGTLQYALEWKGLCEETALHARHAIYITRTPIVRGSPTFFCVQSICPAYGTQARRQVGQCPLVVVNRDELAAHFQTLGTWDVSERLLTDYSENFRRVPGELRRVEYLNLTITRTEAPTAPLARAV